MTRFLRFQLSLAALCLAGCAPVEERRVSEAMGEVEVRGILEDRLRRGRPLPALAEVGTGIDVKIVLFGSNFPLESRGKDQKVWVHFERQKITLCLVVSGDFSEADVRHALFDDKAPVVPVKRFTVVGR
jgi:hypothetical protein